MKRISIRVGLIVILITASFLFLMRNPSGRLLSGATITLERVTYGTNKIPVPGAQFEKYWNRVPQAVRKVIPWQPASPYGSIGARPIPQFHFLLTLADSRFNTALTYAIADENGFESDMIFNGSNGDFRMGGFGTNRALGLIRGLRVLPARSRNFYLRLYEKNTDSEMIRVANFSIRNAAFKNFPVWKPESMPVTKRANDSEFTLKSLDVGVEPPEVLRAGYSRQRGAWSRIEFRTSGGTNWGVHEIWVSEATGNSLGISALDWGSLNGKFSSTLGNEVSVVHRWPLWSDEAAYRLTVHFTNNISTNIVEYMAKPNFIGVPGD